MFHVVWCLHSFILIAPFSGRLTPSLVWLSWTWMVRWYKPGTLRHSDGIEDMGDKICPISISGCSCTTFIDQPLTCIFIDVNGCVTNYKLLVSHRIISKLDLHICKCNWCCLVTTAALLHQLSFVRPYLWLIALSSSPSQLGAHEHFMLLHVPPRWSIPEFKLGQDQF